MSLSLCIVFSPSYFSVFLLFCCAASLFPVSLFSKQQHHRRRLLNANLPPPPTIGDDNSRLLWVSSNPSSLSPEDREILSVSFSLLLALAAHCRACLQRPAPVAPVASPPLTCRYASRNALSCWASASGLRSLRFLYLLKTTIYDSLAVAIHCFFFFVFLS